MNIQTTGWRCAALAVLFAMPTFVSAQGVDTEPNNSCPTAQDVGTQGLPYDISGNLAAFPGVPDIDFFRLSGEPGSYVLVNHRGSWNGFGTLSNPLLGAFDDACNFIALNDDFSDFDSQLVLQVPASGSYVLAATSVPDYSFAGSESGGTYILSVKPVSVADSVSGRLISARTGAPLSGGFPTHAGAYLFTCTPAGGCDIINFSQADDNGGIFFSSRYDGQPLLAGSYQIQAFASGYENLIVESFDLADGESLSLGDLELTPLNLIGMVAGRLLDSIDGSPVRGNSPPYASVYLEQCDDFGCGFLGYAAPDDFGNFVIDGALYQIPPGTYRLVAFAEDYQQTILGPFDIAAFEDVQVGDVLLTPFPIQFGQVVGCDILQAGATCEFGIDILNRGPGRFSGEAWATVYYFANDYPYRAVQFQVGRRGAADPRPEKVRLRAEESSELRFALDLPIGVPDNSTICVTSAVGSGRYPQFATQGDRFLFCANADSGNFSMLSGEVGRKRLREMRDGPRIKKR